MRALCACLTWMVAIGAARAARADDRACLAVWATCTDASVCQSLYDACVAANAPAPRPRLTSSDSASCRALATARPLAVDAGPPEALRALRERVPFDLYDPDRLRNGYMAVLDRLHTWEPRTRDIARKSLNGVCRFAHPWQNKVSCSDAFDALVAAIGGANVSETSSAVRDAFKQMIHGPEGRTCLGSDGWFADESWKYIVLRGLVGDRAIVYEAVSEPGVERVGAVYDAVSLPFAGDSRLMIVAVPKLTRVLIRIENVSNHPQTRRLLEIPSSDQNDFHDVRSSDDACIGLDLQLSANSDVLVDGVPVYRAQQDTILSQPVRVARQSEHQITILRPHADTRRETRNDNGSDTCIPFELDASDDAQEDIAVVPFRVDGECLRGGVNEVALRDHVVRFLKEHRDKKHVRDLSALDGIVRDVSKLESLVAELQGSAVGLERGNQDSVRSVYGGAKEMLRQGFDRVFSMTMLCADTHAGWEYAIAVRSANLAKLRNKKPNEIDWEEIFESQVQQLNSRDELSGGVLAPVARLLKVPYAIFANSAKQAPFKDSVQIPIELYVPPRDADAAAAETVFQPRVFVTPATELECQLVDSRAMLRDVSVRPESESKLAWDEIVARFTMGNEGAERPQQPRPERRYRLEIRGYPAATGLYLLRTTLDAPATSDGGPLSAASQKDRPLIDERCLELTNDGKEVFVHLGWKVSSWYWASNANFERPEEYAHALVLGGLKPSSAGFDLVPMLGLSIASRRGMTPPSFDGLTSGLRFEANGVHDYKVVDRAALIGAALTLQESLCFFTPRVFKPNGCARFVRGVHVFARAGAFARFGFTDLDDVAPAVFPRERDGELNNIDVDFSVLCMLGVGVPLSQHDSLRVTLDWFVPKVFNIAAHNQRTSPGYDNRHMVGIGFEYGRTL